VEQKTKQGETKKKNLEKKKKKKEYLLKAVISSSAGSYFKGVVFATPRGIQVNAVTIEDIVSFYSVFPSVFFSVAVRLKPTPKLYESSLFYDRSPTQRSLSLSINSGLSIDLRDRCFLLLFAFSI